MVRRGERAQVDTIRDVTSRLRAGVREALASLPGRREAERPTQGIERLSVVQEGRLLRIRLTVAPTFRPRALWLKRVSLDEWVRVADVAAVGSAYVASVDLLALSLSDAAEGALYATYLESERREREDSEFVRERSEDPTTQFWNVGGGWVTTRSMTPLGRAHWTTLGALHAVQDGDKSVQPYPNARGVLGIAVNRPVRPSCVVHVSGLAVIRGVLIMRGRLRAGIDVRSAKLVLKGRTSGHQFHADVVLKLDGRRTATNYGLRWYRFDLRLDCSSLLLDPHVSGDTYDAWFRLDVHQVVDLVEVRVGRTKLIPRYLSRPGWARQGDRVVTVTPYYTHKVQNTSFVVNIYESSTFSYMRRQVRMRHINRALNGRRQIWVVGERPYKAQDTGYWFFRYMREHHPDVGAYYVIERDSPERANVAPLGNVVEFGSKEHVRLSLLATRLIGSHHAEFLLPLRTKKFNRAVRATRVFLQHGVMGTKWMATFYGKGASGFETDLFIVSSEREREYIMSDFGYRPEEIAVTGLSRFDSLFAGDVATNPRQVLIMPTWRDWLQDAERYRDSSYHATWSTLLNDPRLHRLVDEHRLELVFCLHPNMQQHVGLFRGLPARVISQGEVDVQYLLKRSAMLITDYSSVGFDFGFLHKPIVYFQFDREMFLGQRGSHLDLDEELPGPIVRTATGVIDELEARVADGFTMSPDYIRRAERFIAHHDRNNSYRIFKAVRQAQRKRRLGRRIATSDLVAYVGKYLRRHRRYFPAMRRMYALARRLPMDRQLVVFESGVGKQYADSPRAIYEELVTRRPDLTKVWVYDRRLPIADPNTKVVTRLSPQYFWYLARAGYWVNNQSFPHYLARRPSGVYVQTWHGTPLKRMLHDLERVHGRDAGYVDRATAAAQQWSVLVSPNRYTTDVMRSAFRYSGEVLEVGYPRNDVLHRTDRDKHASRIRARLGIGPEQRVILYAPTFRDDQKAAGRFAFELPFDLSRAHESLGRDSLILLRMHVLVGSRADIPAHLQDAVRDVSTYPEIQELYLISDALVTDYSSVFFDYASLGRPIVFYAHDLDRYQDTLRGFYLDYERDLPGPIARTEDELARYLADLDEVRRAFADRREAFVERFCPKDDGFAAARVVDAVFGPAHGSAKADDATGRT